MVRHPIQKEHSEYYSSEEANISLNQSMRDQGIPLTIQNLINEFMAHRQEILSDILHHERKYYKF